MKQLPSQSAFFAVKTPLPSQDPLPFFGSLGEWRSFEPGLDRVNKLLEKLGHPQTNYPHLVVGGTNGKGSVCAQLATMLPGKTGLFLSPHLLDIRERITLNGAWASDEKWHQAYDAVRRVEPNPQLSYFEWLLVVAVLIFEMEKVDFGVFEVGLGGRLDAVNSLNPLLSAITSVSLDHQQILGSSIESISLEKIEIARSNKAFVLPRSIFEIKSVARRLDEIGSRNILFDGSRGLFSNEIITSKILRELGVSWNPGLKTRLPGRQEFSDTKAGLFLDGAHNPSAWLETVNWIQENHQGKINILCSLSRGREPKQFLETMKPISQNIYLWPTQHEKELPHHQWPHGVTSIKPSELGRLLKNPLLVCGSLYLIGSVKRYLLINNL